MKTLLTMLLLSSPELTNQNAWSLYAKYLEGWKAVSDEQRKKITSDVVAADARYTTPRHETGGRTTMMEDMAAFQAKYPGGYFTIGDVTAHHDSALLTWVLTQADGKVVARGHDALRVGPDGKITSIGTFAPPVTQP